MIVPVETFACATGQTDATEVVAVEQVGVAIFADRNHQRGGSGAGHIHNYWPRAAQISVAGIERHPVSGAQ